MVIGIPGTFGVQGALVAFSCAATAVAAGLALVRLPHWRRRLADNRTLDRILAETARLGATRRLPELQQRIVDAVAAVLDLPRVALYVWSDGTRSFEPRAFAGYDEDAREQLRAGMPDAATIEALRAVAFETTGDEDNRRSGTRASVRATGDRVEGLLETTTGETVGYLVAEGASGRDLKRLQRELQHLLLHAATALESLAVWDRLARNNAELGLASEKLASLADMKANFVANVSHELRTPLTSISAYTELLQNNLGTLPRESLDEFLRVIHDESLKLSDVIDDILELNRMENGRPTRQRGEADLSALVRRLEEGWRSRAAENRLTLDVNTPDDPINIAVDPVLLQQLFTHLVSNAVKFTAPGGNVIVTLAELGTAVRLTVQDTGIGIPEDKLGAIFDKFYQVDGSATRKHNGQGVGLAICHDIVRHHDGRIWAENVEPKGARFHVLLPRRPAVVQPSMDLPAPGWPFEPGEFLQRLLYWVSASMGVQTVALMEPEAGGDDLQIRAAIGLPDNVVQGVRIRPGQGYVGHTWATGETLLISDVTRDRRFQRAVNEPRYNTNSLLVVPLRDEDGRVRGVVSVNNRVDGRPLDEDDRLLLESLTPSLTVMLDRYAAWSTDTHALHALRETLRSTTDVGHLQQESMLEVCQEVCLATGTRAGLESGDLGDLAFALRYYDVGMSCVPPQLLDKPEPLGPDEEALVQQHVVSGLEVLAPLAPSTGARRIILHHHENFDGSGYPAGLAGESIPHAAKLLRLADSLLAMLSPRPWRPAWTLDAALEELRRGSGTTYCPELTAEFVVEAARRADRIQSLQERGAEDRALTRPVLDRKGMVTNV